MSYEENILNRIDHCFEVQLDKIREYKKDVNSIYEKIINELENNKDIQVICLYNNVYVSDEKLEYEVEVDVPLDNLMDNHIYSIAKQIFKTIDPINPDKSLNDFRSDIEKKNIEYGKKFLNDKFKEYFSKCNFEYSNSVIRLGNKITDEKFEIHLVRKEKYSEIV